MQEFWTSIPAPVRTIINVAVAALITWAATDGLNSLASVDLNPVAKGLLLAVATAVVRALNPADSAYGIDAAAPVGEHTAVDGTD